MPLTRPLSALVCAAALTPSAFSQSFSIPDFSTTSSLALVGDANVTGSALRPTQPAQLETGAGWYDQAVNVTGGFDTQFDFRITSGPTRGQGFAFVVQKNGTNGIGQGGIYLGYGEGTLLLPDLTAMAIEVDTQQNPSEIGDLSNNEISIQIGSELFPANGPGFVAGATAPFDLADGQRHTMRVRYDVVGRIDVFVDDLTTPLVSVDHDLDGPFYENQVATPFYVPEGSAFVGFTGSTGTDTQTVDIKDWSFTSQPLAPACAAGSAGAQNVLSAEYFIGFDPAVFSGFGPTPALRRLTLPSFEPFEIIVDAPDGTTSAPYALFAQLGRADGTTTLPTGFGDFCFTPVAPFSIGPGVAPVRISIPPGLPLLGEITLQGLTDLDPSGSTQLVTTNAVALRFVPLPALTVVEIQTDHGGPEPITTVIGSGFSELATVTVGGVPAQIDDVTLWNLSFVRPAGTPCDTPFVIQNPNGDSYTGLANPTPVIQNVLPSPLSTAGNELASIGGDFLDEVNSVTVDGIATTFNAVSPGAMFFVTPALPAGPATLQLTTFGGCTITHPIVYQ